MTGSGTSVVSTWGPGNFVGTNAAWGFDNPIGQAMELLESGSTSDGITSTWFSTGTTIPWPNPLQATNPCRDRIWLQGDNGGVYEVMVVSQAVSGVSLLASYGTFSREQPTGAQVGLSSVAHANQLSVSATGTVHAVPYTGTVTSDAIYLYGNEEIHVSLSGTDAFNAWTDQTSFGFAQSPPVAALKDRGEISFEITETLPPGNYRLEVTSGNLGQVDSAFQGFQVVITVGDIVFQGVLCSGQRGANFSTTDKFYFALPRTLPGSPSSWLLSFGWLNGFNDTRHGTARQLAISAVKLVQLSTTLYELALQNGGYSLTPVSTAPADFPATPGGWMASITSWGTVFSQTHESNIYPANDTVISRQPVSNLLTGSTGDRREDIILNGSFALSDPSTPPLPVYATIQTGPPVPAGYVFLPSQSASGLGSNLLAGFAVNGATAYAIDVSNAVYSSADGLNWTALGSADGNLVILAYGAGLIVGAGLGGDIETSPTGATWTPRTSGTAQWLHDITFDGSRFVAVGDAGATTTSTNGTTWAASSAGAQNLRGVTSGLGLFVAVGDGPVIYSSANGSTWAAANTLPATSATTLLSVAFSPVLNVFVAVGDNRTVLTSTDGTNWVDASGSPFLVSEALNGVAWGNNHFAIATQSGRVYASDDGTNWNYVTIDPLVPFQCELHIYVFGSMFYCLETNPPV
jgi:hypothetical protein